MHADKNKEFLSFVPVVNAATNFYRVWGYRRASACIGAFKAFRSPWPLLHALDQHRPALPAADAERGDTALAAGAFEHLEHVQHDTRARGADGMADGDGAAVDIELRAVEAAERMVEA